VRGRGPHPHRDRGHFDSTLITAPGQWGPGPGFARGSHAGRLDGRDPGSSPARTRNAGAVRAHERPGPIRASAAADDECSPGAKPTRIGYTATWREVNTSAPVGNGPRTTYTDCVRGFSRIKKKERNHR